MKEKSLATVLEAETGTVVPVSLDRLRTHYQRSILRRLERALLIFLSLMALSAIGMSLDNGPGLQILMTCFWILSFVGFALSRKRRQRLPVAKQVRLASQVEICIGYYFVGVAALMLYFAVLVPLGLVTAPDAQDTTSFLPWTLLTIPVTAWALYIISRAIARRIDPDDYA